MKCPHCESQTLLRSYTEVADRVEREFKCVSCEQTFSTTEFYDDRARDLERVYFLAQEYFVERVNQMARESELTEILVEYLAPENPEETGESACKPEPNRVS